MFALRVCIVFFVALSSFIGKLSSHAFVSNNVFVYWNTTVNNVIMTKTSTSLLSCASLCQREKAASNGCVTATFNSVSNECLMSMDNFTSAFNVNDTSVKTIALTEVCGAPQTISNGFFSVNDNRIGSVATMVCLPGFVSDGVMPQDIICDSSLLWTASAASCVPDSSSGYSNDYYGTSFVFGFLDSPTPQMTLLSLQPCTVDIIIPFLNESQTVPLNGVFNLMLDLSLGVNANDPLISEKGVEIHSSGSDIMVYIGGVTSGSADYEFVFPESSLGTEYIALGHNSTTVSSKADSFLIVGTTSDTVVSVTFPSGTVETFTIGRLDTVYRKGNGLSGTLIQASGKIFVSGGHGCANIPEGAVYCDFVVSTLPPVSAFGTEFIAGQMWPRLDFTIGIAASVDNTNVNISDSFGSIIDTVNLDCGNVTFKTYYGIPGMTLASDNGVLVTQYGHGGSLVFGDPSMMLVPPISHFGNRYEVFTLTGYNSSIGIAVPDGTEGGLLLNGTLLAPAHVFQLYLPGVGNYKMIYISVGVGYVGHLSHLDSNVTFTAWAYGRKSNTEYAMSLGMMT